MPDDQDHTYEDTYSPQEAQTMRLMDLWAQSRPPTPGGGEVPYGGGDLPPEVIRQPTEPGEVKKVDLGWFPKPSGEES